MKLLVPLLRRNRNESEDDNVQDCGISPIDPMLHLLVCKGNAIILLRAVPIFLTRKDGSGIMITQFFMYPMTEKRMMTLSQID